jgi:lipoate-protein ligase A
MNRTSVPSLDTGLRGGAQNNAFDRQWLRLAALGERGCLLRFHRSRPAASVGRHQAADRELRLDYCERRGMDVVRRLSGGGALYLDPGCLCFSLVLVPAMGWRARGMGELLEVLARGVQEGLRGLGVESAFKAPNDLEVAGRKIASVFAAFEGHALLLQGTVLLRADVRVMLEALRVPTEKLSPDGLAAARERLATLGGCLGREPGLGQVRHALEQGLASGLGIRIRHADAEMAPEFPLETPTPERVLARAVDWSRPGEELLEAVWKGGGATLRARGAFIDEGRRYGRVELAGDLHLGAPEWLERLQSALEGLPVGLAPRWVEAFCRESPPDAVGASAADFAAVLGLLAEKHAARAALGLETAQVNALMLYGGGEGSGVRETLERATVMLVPYCAKPAWCKWRHLDGCSECGLCEVGEAYRLARERGMQVTTVTRYEHLVSTLAEMRRRCVPAYVGMCCSNFYIKRHRAFQEAGMPALLMDISGANCYELKQEEQAYDGSFKAEARLDLEALRKVMRLVPAAAGDTRPVLEGGAPGE